MSDIQYSQEQLFIIFQKLKILTSVKDKQFLLEQNKDNEFLKTLLEANLNPYKLFQFNKMPVEHAMPVHTELSFAERHDHFVALLKDLQNRYVTGNKAKEAVENIFKLLLKEEYELYSSILLKEPIGVGVSTVNKVWPNLIPEFKVMLAPSQLPNLTELAYPLYVQPKYDGFRAVFIDGKFYTRSGLVYPNKNLAKYFTCLQGITNYVLDGELYIHGQPFQELSKTLNADNSLIPNGLKYHVYDCLPISDWIAQSTKLSYVDRLQILRGIVNSTVADYSKVIDAPTDLIEDAAQVIQIYKKYLKAGYEGCMLKSKEGKYQWKRTTLRSGEMIKLKPFETLDLKVTNIYDGEGKYEGKAGGIVVDYNGVAVSIGSGFDDLAREEMAKQPDKFIGKTAEIKYFEETEDGSLRFPIFIRWREDK